MQQQQQQLKRQTKEEEEEQQQKLKQTLTKPIYSEDHKHLARERGSGGLVLTVVATPADRGKLLATCVA